MCVRKDISKFSSVILLLMFSYCCNADSISYNQDQAINSAMKRIDLNKINEQQQQTNKDNALAAKIYETTSIPSWRSLIFIHNAKNNGNVNSDTLITYINQFLQNNNHDKLNSNQQIYIHKSVNTIYKKSINYV